MLWKKHFYPGFLKLSLLRIIVKQTLGASIAVGSFLMKKGVYHEGLDQAQTNSVR